MWQMSNYELYLKRVPGSRIKPENYTCFGRFHIKLAITFCIFLSFFFQILQLILTLKHSITLTNISTSISIFLDFLEFLCVSLIILALWHGDERYLIPVIGLKLFLILCWLVQTTVFFIAFIFPKTTARLFVHSMSSSLNEFFRLIIFIQMSAFEMWFYSIILALYVYFNRDREGLISAPRIQFSQDNDQIPSNFVNPNFAPHNSEQ